MVPNSSTNTFPSFDFIIPVDIDKVYLPVDLKQDGAAHAISELVGSNSETNDHDDSTISALHQNKLFNNLWQMTAKTSNGVLYGCLSPEEWPLLQKVKEKTARNLYWKYNGMPLAVRGESTDPTLLKEKEKLVKAKYIQVLKEREAKRVKLQDSIVQMKKNFAAKGKSTFLCLLRVLSLFS